MSRLDSETKRKLREMGVGSLVDALEIQDVSLTLGMVFEERVKLAVDDAHAAFTHSGGLVTLTELIQHRQQRQRLTLVTGELVYLERESTLVDEQPDSGGRCRLAR